MIRFEEFGPQPFVDCDDGSDSDSGSDSGSDSDGHSSFPAPPDAYSPPDGAALDAFLVQAPLWPSPSGAMRSCCGSAAKDPSTPAGRRRGWRIFIGKNADGRGVRLSPFEKEGEKSPLVPTFFKGGKKSPLPLHGGGLFLSSHLLSRRLLPNPAVSHLSSRLHSPNPADIPFGTSVAFAKSGRFPCGTSLAFSDYARFPLGTSPSFAESGRFPFAKSRSRGTSPLFTIWYIASFWPATANGAQPSPVARRGSEPQSAGASSI